MNDPTTSACPPRRIVAHSVATWLKRTENWIYSQIRNLQSWSPWILCVDDNGDFSVPDIPKLCGQSRNPLLIQTARVMRRLRLDSQSLLFAGPLKKAGVSILHSHFGTQAYRNRGLASRLGLKHVVSVYGSDVTAVPASHPHWRDRYRDMFGGVAAVICEGPAMAARIASLGCPEEILHVIPIGIAFENIVSAPASLAAEEPLRILIAGTFREKKGIPYAIEAIGLAVSREPDMRVALTIIGDVEDAAGGPEREKILAAISKWNLQKATAIRGYQPLEVLRKEYGKHHVFLSPSVTATNGDAEGGAPVSIIEASASMLPVISTLHCDIPEIVSDGHTGLLVPERDAAALAESIAWLYRNPGEITRLGSNGAEHVRERHDIRVMISRLESLYDSLL